MISRLSVAAVACFTTSFALPPHHAEAQTAEVVVGTTLNMSSSSFVDAFDSSNPFKSTNGLYDPAKIESDYTAKGVGILNNINSDLHGGFIFGSLYYSGTAPKNPIHVLGVIATPFTTTVSPANDPTWIPDVTYVGGSSAPRAFTVPATYTSTNPMRVKVNGDYSLPGGSTAQIVPSASGQDGYIQIWVTGKLNISGSSRMMQDPRVHVTWIVDKDITVTGDSYQNQIGLASNLSFVGVNTGKVNVSGASNLPATFNASSRDVTVSGGGSISGGMYSKTLTLSGNSSIHCDEALLAH